MPPCPGSSTTAPPLLLDRVSDERCLSLIGMAGAGKSTLSVLLARRLGWACLDTDRLIEATHGRRLAELLAERGRDAFLALEEEVVAGLSVKRCVVATGGSVVYCPRAVARLKESGPVVHLAIDLATFLARVGDPGARAFVCPPGQGLEEVYADRFPRYEAAADLTVSSTGVAPTACVDNILRGLHW